MGIDGDKTRLTRRFSEALVFAAEAHDGQYRKGAGVPYVSHVLQVAGIALEHGADEDQAIAALLHDVVEDTDYSGADIADRFGDRVAKIVLECSDAEDPNNKPPWRERKERYLAHLVGAGADTALVSCADKLHNARSIVTDLKEHGPGVFERFTGKREGTLWYYEQIAETSSRLSVPEALVRELTETIQAMRELA